MTIDACDVHGYAVPEQCFSHYPSWPAPLAVPLAVSPEHPCVYLPDRSARMRDFAVARMSPAIYHEFMDAGFRRGGRIIYQPVCRGCRACVPIRVPVDLFRPDKSQRRCARKNGDLSVEIAAPVPTDEKYALYCRYLRHWHGQESPADPSSTESRQDFERFLYDSPVQTVEFTYRSNAGQLLAVGICDLCEHKSLSSVYFYFEPDHARRGLGTYGALCEIAFARSRWIPHYYLGYWVGGCGSMQYKASFRPCEILCTDGQWRQAPPKDPGSAHGLVTRGMLHNNITANQLTADDQTAMNPNRSGMRSRPTVTEAGKQ